MATANPTDIASEAGDFLTSLLGLNVTVAESGPPESVGVAVLYVDREDKVRAQILCDVPCAAILGAALTQIPMGTVSDSISSGELSANLQDNAAEVFNIAVNLLPNHANRLVLKETIFGSASQDISNDGATSVD
ncbi:MAG: hypothetical protein AAGJ83_09470, partial [Planctomycetota bacterium]